MQYQERTLSFSCHGSALYGIASVPDYMARDNPHLVKVLPDLPGPNFEVYFIYPSDLKRSKRIAAFRQFLIDQAASWKE